MKTAVFFPVFYVARVMFYDFTAKHVAVDVRVNFGCRYGFMSQHTLYGPQVCSSFEQVGGERVAEGMGAYVFDNSGGFR